MKINKRLLSAAAVTAVVTGALGTGIGVAHAATNLGGLTVSPATGSSNSLLSMSTAPGSACPSGAAGILIDLSGPGINNTSANALQGFTDYANVTGPSGNIVVGGVANRFVDIFQAYSINNPSGDYTVRIACIGDDFFTETGEFTQVLTFTPTATQFVSNYASPVAVQSTSTVLSGPASSGFGSSVTFTANVDPDGAAGTVQFKDGATNLGSPQAVDAAGVASFTGSTLSVGSHNITAVFSPTSSAYTGSTSNVVAHTVSAASTSLSLISNGPTAQYATASFTATVSPAVAGTVTFSEGATTLGSVPANGSGVAVFNTTGLSVGTHAVSAHFEPAGPGAAAADAGPINHVVNAFAGIAISQNLIVTVPDGALTMVLDDGADGNVDLGTAVMSPDGDKLTAAGDMDVIKVTDTRAGDPGWQVSGIVTDFVKGPDSVNGYNLGWNPFVVSLSANQTGAFVEGVTVAAGNEQTADSTPSDLTVGLESARVLGTAPDNSGNGTAKLGASLALNIPTDVPGGVYAAVLTLTAS